MDKAVPWCAVYLGSDRIEAFAFVEEDGEHLCFDDACRFFFSEVELELHQ